MQSVCTYVWCTKVPKIYRCVGLAGLQFFLQDIYMERRRYTAAAVLLLVRRAPFLEQMVVRNFVVWDRYVCSIDR